MFLIRPIPAPGGFGERGRGDSIFALKLSAEIIDRVESAGIADLLNRIDSFCKHFTCDLQSVPDQDFYGRTVHEGFETASDFTAAHIGCFGKIVKRNMTAVMMMDKIKHFLHPDLIDQLNTIGWITGKRVDLQKNVFQN